MKFIILTEAFSATDKFIRVSTDKIVTIEAQKEGWTSLVLINGNRLTVKEDAAEVARLASE